MKRQQALLSLLVGLVALIAVGIAAIRIFGGDLGAPCRDSYSCSGFLFGGAECLAADDGQYCTIYCRSDGECPSSWRCLGANPTILTVETRAVGRVCVRPIRK